MACSYTTAMAWAGKIYESRPLFSSRFDLAGKTRKMVITNVGQIVALPKDSMLNLPKNGAKPYDQTGSGEGEGIKWKKPGLKYTQTITIDGSVDPPTITIEYKLP